ncbi:hypothetical protein C0992_010828 [Termitomyces sp. T32_za158]|nr:hypothetical protein C0992_010828 [Termitomyces sp. T32_za158]
MTENSTSIARSKHPAHLSWKLADPDNIGEIQLSSHQASRKQVLEQFKAPKRTLETAGLNLNGLETALSQPTKKTCTETLNPQKLGQSEAHIGIHASTAQQSSIEPRSVPIHRLNQSIVEDKSELHSQLLLQSSPSTEPVQNDISNNDSEINDIQEIEPPKPQMAVRTCDVNHFFLKQEGKNVHECWQCSKKCGLSVVLVSNVSTLQHHLQLAHMVVYKDWCNKYNFDSMLLEDVKACKEMALADKQS